MILRKGYLPGKKSSRDTCKFVKNGGSFESVSYDSSIDVLENDERYVCDDGGGAVDSGPLAPCANVDSSPTYNAWSIAGGVAGRLTYLILSTLCPSPYELSECATQVSNMSSPVIASSRRQG